MFVCCTKAPLYCLWASKPEEFERNERVLSSKNSATITASSQKQPNPKKKKQRFDRVYPKLQLLSAKSAETVLDFISLSHLDLGFSFDFFFCDVDFEHAGLHKWSCKAPSFNMQMMKTEVKVVFLWLNCKLLVSFPGDSTLWSSPAPLVTWILSCLWGGLLCLPV